MRARWAGALVLLLSWFLPVAPQAPAVHHIAAHVLRNGHQAVWTHQQGSSGVRHLPYRGPDARAWAGPYAMAGHHAAGVVPGTGLRFRTPWAAVVAAAVHDAPAVVRPSSAAARAPPSTGF
ncbi:hypothetical protein SAMN05421874_104216 [Nonomuraea maritima]|uniref:Uncharacterized protein n=1 Tax=Nonomuraea maritima TaxID=683260 RepID=A0A1G8Y0D0_9ACTN|nr:hypothetical protein SAMN05421874_104216 [Nonomuraea maritima]